MSKPTQTVTALSANETEWALPCVVCKRALENLVSVGNQPSGGTEFLSYGHYGSTVFDPMDGSRLVINVCDTCLRDAVTSASARLFR